MAAVTPRTKRESPKIDSAGVETGAKMFVGFIAVTALGHCVQVWPPLPLTHSTVIPANSRLSRSRTETAASSNSHSQRRWHRGQRQNVSPCVKISSTAQHSDAYSPASRASSEVLILGLLLLFESSHRKQLSFQTGLGCLRYSTARMTVKQSNLPEY